MNIFDLTDRIVVITGGYGILGSSMAQFMVSQGARVAILGRDPQKGAECAERIAQSESAPQRIHFLQADVLDSESLKRSLTELESLWGTPQILINAAGGNQAGATISPDQTIFDININALRAVIDLNLMGTVLPTLIFGEAMAQAGKSIGDRVRGSIINISSMSAQRVITRVVGYSASKAAIDNFTRWMAVELANKFGECLRVNAIAPGFFLTEQNRTLLTNPDGSLTERSIDIMHATPYHRFGLPHELNGTLAWLASDASSFVTGVVVPVDGGFAAFSGV